MLRTLEEPADRRENHVLFDRLSALDIAAFVVDGVDLSPGAAIPSDGDVRIDRALARVGQRPFAIAVAATGGVFAILALMFGRHDVSAQRELLRDHFRLVYRSDDLRRERFVELAAALRDEPLS